jgi:DNA-binding Lrp family transcriptional regulator
MVKAYIMTSMNPGTYTKALEEIKKIDHVEKISIVTGDYDIVVKVNVHTLEHLHKITSRLHMINGIQKTTTQVIEKEIDLSETYKNVQSV